MTNTILGSKGAADDRTSAKELVGIGYLSSLDIEDVRAAFSEALNDALSSEGNGAELLGVFHDVLEVEHARRAAVQWLDSVHTNEMLPQLLTELGCAPLAPNMAPDYGSALAYALASNTLASDQFAEYAALMGYRYWSDERERLDMIHVTGEIWSLPSRQLPCILPELYRHILRNSPEQTHLLDGGSKWSEEDSENEEPSAVAPYAKVSGTGGDGGDTGHKIVKFRLAQGPWTLSDSPLGQTLAEGRKGNSDEPTIGALAVMGESGHRVSTLLQDITDDRVCIVQAPGLKHFSGVLFTGPRKITLIIGPQASKAGEDVIAAHLLAHLLLAHLDRNRFHMWLEHLPGHTPRKLAYNLEHWYAEEEADNYTVCLLDPEASSRKLTVAGTRLLVGFLQLGVSRKIVRGLLRLREAQSVSIVALLRAISLIPLLRAPKPRLGQIVTGTDRHVYYISGETGNLKKHWICSYRLLDACCKDSDRSSARKGGTVKRILDSDLRTLQSGSPIATLDEALEVGLCRDCGLAVTSSERLIEDVS